MTALIRFNFEVNGMFPSVIWAVKGPNGWSINQATIQIVLRIYCCAGTSVSLRRIRRHSLKSSMSTARAAHRTKFSASTMFVTNSYSTTKKRRRQWYKHSVLLTATPFQQPTKKTIEHDPDVIKEKGCCQIPDWMFSFCQWESPLQYHRHDKILH